MYAGSLRRPQTEPASGKAHRLHKSIQAEAYRFPPAGIVFLGVCSPIPERSPWNASALRLRFSSKACSTPVFRGFCQAIRIKLAIKYWTPAGNERLRDFRAFQPRSSVLSCNYLCYRRTMITIIIIRSHRLPHFGWAASTSILSASHLPPAASFGWIPEAKKMATKFSHLEHYCCFEIDSRR